jgi:hypothetical protein
MASSTLTPTIAIATPVDTPVVVVNEEVVIIPPDTAQVVTIEQKAPIRITEIINMILAIAGLVGVALMFYRGYAVKPLHLIYVATWMMHYLLFSVANILNLLGLLTLAYSDVLFIRWRVLLNFHILFIGTLTVIVAYMNGGKPHGD